MRLRLTCVVVLMVLLAPIAARANDHVASIFGGFGMLTGSTHRGGHGSVEVALPFGGHEVGVVVDSSVHGGTDGGTPITKATVLFGLRGLYKPNPRLILFAHLMGGGHRSHIGAVADNGRAAGAGGGFDILLNNAGSATSSGGSGWIFRNQYDWVNVAGKNSLRASAGVGYRYHR